MLQRYDCDLQISRQNQEIRGENLLFVFECGVCMVLLLLFFFVVFLHHFFFMLFICMVPSMHKINIISNR